MLCDNPNIVTLLDNKDINYPYDLINVNIFPRLKVSFTQNETLNYIGLKIDYPSITSNEDLKNCTITFMIISNMNCIQAPTGESRTDLIAEELIKMFNWNYKLGFTLKLVSDMENPLPSNTDYYYRILQFKTLEKNSIGNKLNNGV